MFTDLKYIKLLSQNEVDFHCQNSMERVRACKRDYNNAFQSLEKYATKLEQNKKYKSENDEAILAKKI